MEPEKNSQAEQANKVLTALKRRRFELLQAKKNALRENRFALFQPHPGQLSFFDHTERFLRAGFCGNRWGKSTIGVVEDCAWLLGERSFFPEGDPRRLAGIPRTGVKGLVIGSTWGKVEEIFTENQTLDKPGKFFEYLPPSSIKRIDRRSTGEIERIVTSVDRFGVKRESSVTFYTVQTFKQNPDSAESSDWDFIHLDEPIPIDLWKAVARGLLDRSGRTWWLMTGIRQPWMYEFVKAAELKSPGSVFAFSGATDDNPLLSKESVDQYSQFLEPDEIESRRRGIPLHRVRLVYGEFDSSRHVYRTAPAGWTEVNDPPAIWPVGYLLDPHPQTPHAVLFFAIGPDNKVYLYDELFEKLLISELADRIKEKVVGRRLVHQWCDPIAWITNPETGRCWADTLHARGLYVRRAPKDLSNGIIETQDFIRQDRLRVSHRLANFLREIDMYHFDKDDKPVDKHDHFMECLYRMVMGGGLNFNLGATQDVLDCVDLFPGTEKFEEHFDDFDLEEISAY